MSTFLYRADRLELDALPVDDVYLYFSMAFNQLGLRFEEGQMLRAARATGGMPYMMQLLGRNIDNGIVVSKGYGSVAFAMPHFADWLRKELADR